MSTYVLMRILESTPRRYDLGTRLLTFGAVDRAYDRLAATSPVASGCSTSDAVLGPWRSALHFGEPA